MDVWLAVWLVMSNMLATQGKNALLVLLIANFVQMKLIVRNVLKATTPGQEHVLTVLTSVKTRTVINSTAHVWMAVSKDIRVRMSNVKSNAHLTAYNVTCTILKLALCVLLDFMVIIVIRAVCNAKTVAKNKHAMKATEPVNMVVKLVTGVRCVLNNVRIVARIRVVMIQLERVLMDVMQRIMDGSVNTNVALTA